MSAEEKIARILHTKPVLIEQVSKRLELLSGRRDIFDQIVAENEELIREKLGRLGLNRLSSSDKIFDALLARVGADDQAVVAALGGPDCRLVTDCERVAETARRLVNPPPGYFLKLDQAREFLIKEPPRRVMAFLGYKTPQAMVEREDLFQIYSALRFIEGNNWLNTIFFRQYERLTPADFEERAIQIKVLDKKWSAEAQRFVMKKRHNVSHLKELGIVFVIPELVGVPGEILRMFSLILHYLHEIPFYAAIFRERSRVGTSFASEVQSLLRGDVLEQCPVLPGRSCWLVIQRYLAKDDENDPRLFEPHINPEAWHWLKAGEDFGRLRTLVPGVPAELEFWNGLDWIGDYFLSDHAPASETFVSFNLVDAVMSLVKKKEMAKYKYHQPEALWNKIFMTYLGREKLEEVCVHNLLEGYVAL